MEESIIWLTVGKLVSPQGMKGQIRVNPSTDFSERFTKPGYRWLQQKNEEPKKVELTSGRKHPGRSIYIVSFFGIKTREEAELLIGQTILVPSNDRPSLNDGEFHFLDLVGLKVKLSKNNQLIGEVIDLTHAGNDLLEIKLIKGKNILIPFVKEIVPIVDIKKGYILISPPPGLLEL